LEIRARADARPENGQVLSGFSGFPGQPCVDLAFIQPVPGPRWHPKTRISKRLAYFVFVDSGRLLLLLQQQVVGPGELAIAVALLPGALIGTLIGR
jgi:hypothetical protein